MADVQARIQSRQALPGSRLPSVRAQAQALGVSVSTVVEGYERLAAEGLITARPGSGYYVAGPVAPLALARVAPRVDRAVDPLWVSRQSLEAAPGVLRPGCGWLPPHWMYEAGVRRALRRLARAEASDLTEYGPPLGHAGLRQVLARRLAGQGLPVDAGQILLTESGTQAIDLVCRFLLAPGDTVLVDAPCYFNFHALLKGHRVQVVGVPYTRQGPDVPAFEAALQAHSPRLYLTNSGLHNPTGASLSPTTAHRVLQLAERHKLLIVEDDIFADFETTPAPRLAAFDGLSRVIQIGSFSKTLSAALRCGYIAARPDWVDALTDLKIATSFGGGRMAAEVLLGALTDSGYRKHMEGIRQRLSSAMARTAERLQALGIVPAWLPTAGMFLWCRLPEGHDAATLAQTCLAQGVVLAPGPVFSQHPDASAWLRFNASQCEDPRVFAVLARALQGQSSL